MAAFGEWEPIRLKDIMMCALRTRRYEFSWVFDLGH